MIGPSCCDEIFTMLPAVGTPFAHTRRTEAEMFFGGMTMRTQALIVQIDEQQCSARRWHAGYGEREPSPFPTRKVG